MTRKLGWLTRIVAILAVGLTFSVAALAQTATSVDVRNFEVIQVDGNQLIFRDERGTNEITVPADFRFTVDGKQLAVSDLKPGMKGTATVTTTAKVVPVVVTDLRKGVVLSVKPYSLIVRDDADGVRKRFTQDQVDERGLKIFKDGRPIAIRDVHQGDELTAMIVTQGPPVVVTEKEVEATLAQATPAKTEAPAPAAQTASPAASAQPMEAAPAMAAPPASAAVESSGLGMMGWLVIILLVAVVLFFFARRRKTQ